MADEFTELKNKKLRHLYEKIKSMEFQKVDEKNMGVYVDWINSNRVIVENLENSLFG